MELLETGFFASLWLGILTSISPCPLATNIAAISFIGKNVGEPISIVLNGIFYTVGRMFAYFFIAFFVIESLLSLPEIARFLQKFMNFILGPLLILVGVYLLDLIKINIFNVINFSEKLRERAAKQGLLGSFALGGIFALSLIHI